MSFQCGFFNSINQDRLYNAEQMNNPYSRIVSDGVFASANGRLSTDLQVVADSGLNVIVKEGQGMFASKWGHLDADELITIATPNVTNPRIDSIIVRIDTSDEVRAGTIVYRQGTPATSPVAPSLESSSYVKEYRLANIYVSANATEITQANITDTRPGSECGIVSNLLANSDITTTYAQWQAQFEEWFFNLKETLTSVTAISSFTSTYNTTSEGETEIPINISRYNSVTDILQVYINGLLLIPEVEYTIQDFETIVLTNPVHAETPITFIVYKSVDGSEAETVISQINELYTRVEKLESKTDEALWTGANTMGAGQTITPSKKLSECRNGWVLVWSDYDETTGVANSSQVATAIIPKQIAPCNSFYSIIPSAIGTTGTVTSAGKSLSVTDASLSGYVGNVATTDGQDVCLKAIYEY